MIESMMNILCYLLFGGIAVVVVVVIGFYQYMATSSKRNRGQNIKDNSNNQSSKNQNKHYELTILLGSGGHTGELTLMLKHLQFNKLTKLNVLITSNDTSSQGYFENFLFKDNINTTQIKDKLTFHKVARTNQVKQNYFTAIFTTIKSLMESVKLIRNYLINTTHFVANGPGTCVPFFFLFFVLNKMKITKTKLIFIQSWCRVKTISLSGKIVKHFADKFLVHWPEQKQNYPWTEYQGKML